MRFIGAGMEKKSLEVRDGALDGTLGVASSSCAWAVGRTVGCESDGIGSRNNHSTGLNLSLSQHIEHQQLAHQALRNSCGRAAKHSYDTVTIPFGICVGL